MTITKKNLLLYAYNALPLAFAGLPLYIYAPDFYATEHSLSLTLIGIILTLTRLIDALLDPFIGFMADKMPSWRTRLFYCGLFFLAIGFLLLFYPTPSYISLWFTISLILCSLGYSFSIIMLNSIGTLWSKKESDLQSINVWREGFALVGLVLGAISPTILKNFFPPHQAFFIFSILYASLCLISAMLFSIWHHQNKNYLTEKTVQQSINLKSIGTLLSIKNIRHFYYVYFVSLSASAIPAILLTFYIRDFLKAEADTALFLVTYFVATLISVPIWLKIAQKIGSSKAWWISILLTIFSFIWTIFLQPHDIMFFTIICFASGFALGGEFCLPPAFLSIMLNKYNQTNHSSFAFSIVAFLLKLSLAICAAFVFPILDYVGFKAESNNSQFALNTLIILYAIIPCIIKFIALIYSYKLCFREKILS